LQLVTCNSQVGDALLLTKPIGTGALFAAHMRGAAPGASVAAAVQAMSTSNAGAAECLQQHGCSACTDVTGFGLLGHLVEMARASHVGASLDMEAVPILPGVVECVAAGIFSSLQPANLRLRRAIANEEEALRHPHYPLLFDPQTAGGLLASLPAEQAEACVAQLRHLGYVDATIIGKVSQPLSAEQEATGHFVLAQ